MKVIEFALFWMSATSHFEQNPFQYDADSITGELDSCVSKYIESIGVDAPALMKFEMSQCVFPTVPWFPQNVSDLDKCSQVVTKLEPQLDMDHPGWSDREYRKRRTQISLLSLNYRQ